jgi:asparagine synthase (glutamine-hydrolysing)
MTAAIRHRGPDDEGYWHDGDVALGFVRLSILDLDGGAQPMPNEDGTVQVVFNGEIYNHLALRRELRDAGHRFRSDHADTEVLVHGWEEWGTALLPRLNGMFALAIWDGRARTLLLARDRYGIKPLYLSVLPDGSVVFASELRAIHASALVEKREDRDAILEYVSQQNLWSGRALFRDIEEFPAGHWERIERGRRTRIRYWDYRFRRDRALTLADAAEQHREILARVVRRQLAADVPVMAYLSGGIDSSALVSAAHRHDPTVAAYSCLFDLAGVGDDRVVDERDASRAVAQHLRLRHVELELAQDALAASLEPTVHALETPRMGMSYVNYLIAGRAGRDGKVVLSGMGGDELHAGYVARYHAVQPDRATRRSTPGPLGRAWHRLRRRSREPLPDDVYVDMLNFPVHHRALEEALTPEFLRGTGAYAPGRDIRRVLAECPYTDPFDRVMYVDAKTYLHGLLAMEDKLSMAHSLETRVPLLDNELVDFVSGLPWHLLIDGASGKLVFRESARPWVPDAIYRKPKMGFGPPDASWYRGALRPFIEEYVSPRHVARRGLFRPEFVRRILDEHFSGRANHVATIWSLLSLEAWCRTFGMLGGRP